MTDDVFDVTSELTAIGAVMTALQPLSELSRKRVVSYVLSKLDMRSTLEGRISQSLQARRQMLRGMKSVESGNSLRSQSFLMPRNQEPPPIKR